MEDFCWIQDKKVFFVDETFHIGRWVEWILLLRKLLPNSDMWYFALSSTGQSGEIRHFSSPQVVIYPFCVQHLFSVDVANAFFEDKVISRRNITSLTHYKEDLENFSRIYSLLHDRIIDALERADAPNRLQNAAE